MERSVQLHGAGTPAAHRKLSHRMCLLALLGALNIQIQMLHRCLKVTDAGYESLAQHCRQLCELRMYACNIISDRTLVALGARLASLRVVDMCGANSISGVQLPPVFCPTVRQYLL